MCKLVDAREVHLIKGGSLKRVFSIFFSEQSIFNSLGLYRLVILMLFVNGCESPLADSEGILTSTLRGEQQNIIRGSEPTLESTSQAGPFVVKVISQEGGLRNGPEYGSASLYYPAGAMPPWASIVIVPGFISSESSIQDWGPFYASHGIVTMTIGTNHPLEQPANRATALLDALVSLCAEHTRSGSPLEGRLALDRVGVSGWSMGGGGAQLAAVEDPTLRAVIALCPWKPNAQFNHPVPLLILCGQNDWLAPSSYHGVIHYQNTPASTPKLIFEVAKGRHRVANSPLGGNGEVGRLAISWLKVFLEGDDRYRRFLLQKPKNASLFQSNLE